MNMVVVIVATILFFFLFWWLTIHANRLRAMLQGYSASKAKKIGYIRPEPTSLRSPVRVPPIVLHTGSALPVMNFLNLPEDQKFKDESHRPYLISQDVLVGYAKICPMGTPFTLRTVFCPNKELLGELTEQLRKQKAKQGKPGLLKQHLNFEALEKEPRLKVEVTFPPDTFKADTTSIVKTLSEDKTTEFRFTLVPLLGAELLVCIRVKYLEKAIEIVEETEEKETTKEPLETNASKIGTTEKETHTSKTQSKEQEIEVLTIEMPISAKAFWKLNSQQLSIATRVFGIVVIVPVIFLVYKFFPNASLPYAIGVGACYLLNPILGAVDFSKFFPPKEPEK